MMPQLSAFLFEVDHIGGIFSEFLPAITGKSLTALLLEKSCLPLQLFLDLPLCHVRGGLPCCLKRFQLFAGAVVSSGNSDSVGISALINACHTLSPFKSQLTLHLLFCC